MKGNTLIKPRYMEAHVYDFCETFPVRLNMNAHFSDKQNNSLSLKRKANIRGKTANGMGLCHQTLQKRILVV